MTIEQQIKETVELAKEMSLTAFKKFSEDGEVPVQTAAEAERIIAGRKWLYENFEPVPVNPPNTRTRMGFSPEAIAAMTAHFSAKANDVTKLEKLKAAISSTDTSGFPGAWTVDQREDGDILLVWTADLKDVPNMDGDEPWTIGGGYAIAKAADIGDYRDSDSGSDSYQDKYGDDVVTQWVCFKK